MSADFVACEVRGHHKDGILALDRLALPVSDATLVKKLFVVCGSGGGGEVQMRM